MGIYGLGLLVQVFRICFDKIQILGTILYADYDSKAVAFQNLLFSSCFLVIDYAELRFVATLVECFRSLFDIFKCCLFFGGFVLSVGALYCLSGLCIVCWGFV